MDIGDDDNPLEARVHELIERGLSRYGDGDMEGALSEWKHALALDPDSERAANYMSYVEEHHDLATNEEDIHRESTVELSYPFGLAELGLARLRDEDLDEYESFEIVAAGNEEAEDDDITKTLRISAASQVVDDGWTVDDGWAEGLVNKSEKTLPSSGGQRRAARAQARPTSVPGSPMETSFADLELDFESPSEVDPSEMEPTLARSGGSLVDAEIAELGVNLPNSDDLETIGSRLPSEGLCEDPIELGGAGGAGHDDNTRPGGARRPQAADPARRGFDELELDLEALEPTQARPEIPDAIDRGEPDISIHFDGGARADTAMDDELTIDRGGLQAAGLVARGRAPTEDSGLLSLSLNIDESSHADQDLTNELSLPDIDLDEDDDAVPGLAQLEPPSGSIDIGLSTDELAALDVGSSPVAATADDVLAKVTAEAPQGDAGARTQFIVGRLLEIGGQQFEEGRRADAATAIAHALDHADDNAGAQKMVFENERRIVQILIGSLGGLGEVPSLVVPLTAIPLDQIEHRAAFLLTRVDGQLTLDEILDVSGMPRMEALRHLSRVHAKGFLKVAG